jgi:hypothetical protein
MQIDSKTLPDRMFSLSHRLLNGERGEQDKCSQKLSLEEFEVKKP